MVFREHLSVKEEKVYIIMYKDFYFRKNIRGLSKLLEGYQSATRLRYLIHK